MGLIRNLAGQIRIRLTSADVQGALDAVSAAGILAADLRYENELRICFTVARRDYRKLRAIAARRGEILCPVARSGIYWDVKRLLERPVLLLGLTMLLFLTLFLPSRVLFLEVQGNTSIPANRILEAAGECGITFGASRREVRSEKMKNALLDAMPELGWAGINTYGCRAVISVRERDTQPEPEEVGICHLVAARDGYILSCDTVSGNALCTPGQAVKAGEILISGYTDCGICVTATRAAGEVMAATRHCLTAVTPAECIKKGKETGEEVNYSLIVGKIRINFRKNSGISGASCDRMVTNYHLTLPGGYRLPVTLTKQTVTKTELVVTQTDGAALQGFAVRYLGTRMIAGTVTDAAESITGEDGIWVLQGEYACTEMIARVQAEQNGELHETD